MWQHGLSTIHSLIRRNFSARGPVTNHLNEGDFFALLRRKDIEVRTCKNHFFFMAEITLFDRLPNPDSNGLGFA
jgi:hypothetical protein